MSRQRYTALLGALLSGYLYGLDFQDRSFYPALYRGVSRAAVFAAKLLLFAALESLLSLLAVLLAALFPELRSRPERRPC